MIDLYSDSVPRSQPGVVTLARVLISIKSRHVEFWRGGHLSDQTRFHKTAFSGRNRNNSNNIQTRTNRLMTIIEIWPNKVSNQNFVRFLLPPKCICLVLDLSVLFASLNDLCNSQSGGAIRGDALLHHHCQFQESKTADFLLIGKLKVLNI
jgi:hypothetical protein